MRRTKLPNTVKNLILLGVVLLLCFMIAEAVVRVLDLVPDYGIPRNMAKLDSETGYSLVPGYTGSMRGAEFDVPVLLNSQGLRDDEFAPAKYTVLVLGDSFQFGYGVTKEEIYTELAEKQLRSQGKEVTFVNAGVEGWGPAEELLLLNRSIAEYQPDLVIVSYFIGNDMQDTALFPRNYSFYRGYVIEGSVTSSLRTKVFVAEYCKTCLLVYRIIQRTRYSSVSDLNGSVLELRQFSQAQDPEITAAWNKTITTLQTIQQVSEEHEAAFLVVLIPSKTQFLADVPEGFVRDRPNTILTNQSFTVLDLRAKGLNMTDYYFVHDGHWNAQGHEKAAQLLLAYLNEDSSFFSDR